MKYELRTKTHKEEPYNLNRMAEHLSVGFAPDCKVLVRSVDENESGNLDDIEDSFGTKEIWGYLYIATYKGTIEYGIVNYSVSAQETILKVWNPIDRVPLKKFKSMQDAIKLGIKHL